MTQWVSLAQGCLVRVCLSGALLLLSAPALWASSTSNEPSPAIAFATPGVKQVTLEVCNTAGCSSVTKEVTVLDPSPAVTSASFAPLLPEAGQLVLLTGTGKGKPPLTFGWQVSQAGGSPLISVPFQSFWWNTSGFAPGVYTVSLQIENGTGTTSLPLPLVLAPATPLDFYTVTPCRLYDSRQGLPPLASGVARIVQAAGSCDIPAGARALAANVTVITPTGLGNVSLYPGNYPPPVASTVNFLAGVTRSNHAILPLATDGAGTLAALASIVGNGSTHVAIDVSGYYAP